MKAHLSQMFWGTNIFRTESQNRTFLLGIYYWEMLEVIDSLYYFPVDKQKK